MSNNPIPKVTYDDVVESIRSTDYSRLGERTTLCTLTLDNGFTVVGSSTTVDVEHFDTELGNTAAYNHAVRRVWGYLAFRQFERRMRGEI